uniref:helix-turn-helix domain-containing protein n=1 Tax=Lactobacillus acidophilus TaxID=1579 RepID=UPI003F5767F6
MPAEEKMREARDEITKAIKIKLIERGISQTELADMLRVSRQSVNLAIKGGSADYLVEIRKRIYKILGMSDE